MRWFWGTRISVLSNNTVKAAAKTAYRATDMIVKVSIDNYLGQQQLWCENNL